MTGRLMKDHPQPVDVFENAANIFRRIRGEEEIGRPVTAPPKRKKAKARSNVKKGRRRGYIRLPAI